MSARINLSDRYQHILKATIQHYIATAEPVGSKTLLEEYKFTVSSATIRNALGKLEKEGLLYQPHTSSGRIPSDWGYRLYVDELMTPDDRIGEKIGYYLHQNAKSPAWSLESLLQRATQFLAGLSGYIAIVTLPHTLTNTLRHLQLIPVSNRQIMLIIVTDSLQTRSVMIEIPESMATDKEDGLAEELQILSNFLGEKLKGYCLADLINLDWQQIEREFTRYTHFLQQLSQEISASLQSTATPEIIVHGVAEVIRQPEFAQWQQVQMLLNLLEAEQDRLLPLILQRPEPEKSAKKVKITIGSENPLESMRPCTLISAFYKQGDTPVGSVGIIGPTRMLYENTIPLVESTANYLSEAISK
ncbi:heat-inducible transcriptional repressor HrcA [Microcystis aeruginosa]|uniref:heat-inducible transcriptional repressor HrcA n=1 Tax=Microcystis aeruginosa TaxID=1126 RepID=UPI00232D663F|nr:heat-inducible transcriptional repressor HrcA [Microcystis aeruginosa]MDB9418345.1 heat-inducible transcriptional repressor HrcA [Microcystis aeruginosa CS-556/03]